MCVKLTLVVVVLHTELIITAGGENIPPVPIEDAVKAEAAIVSNAMLLGDKLKFLSMFLTLKVSVLTRRPLNQSRGCKPVMVSISFLIFFSATWTTTESQLTI